VVFWLFDLLGVGLLPCRFTPNGNKQNHGSDLGYSITDYGGAPRRLSASREKLICDSAVIRGSRQGREKKRI